VAFVSTERWPLERPIPEDGDWEVVPDLAVEVTSSHDLWDEVLAKMHEYFEKGVRQGGLRFRKGNRSSCSNRRRACVF
jgi:Uma2 family endonuclease